MWTHDDDLMVHLCSRDLDNDYPADGSAYEIDDSYPAKEGATAKVAGSACLLTLSGCSTSIVRMVPRDRMRICIMRNDQLCTYSHA